MVTVGLANRPPYNPIKTRRNGIPKRFVGFEPSPCAVGQRSAEKLHN